jgi:hypothetical protein
MTLAVTDYKDGVLYTGLVTAGTVGPFYLLGGKYLWVSQAASTSQQLQVLGPDGSTYLAVNAQTTSAVSQALDLPPGTYEIVCVATGALMGFLQKVPYNPAY